MKILLTTTSFQDTPGPHHQILEDAGFEIIRERGPLPEKRMLDLVGDIDAFLCGDDEITSKVIDRALPRLKVVSKYGIGLDKIDMEYLTDKGVPLTFCPGVNHTTVSEHTFALMLALFRKLVKEANHVAKGEWVRVTGNEIMGKTLSIIGLGRIGKEVAIRANAFGMKVIGYDLYWDEDFARGNQIIRAKSIDEALEQGDVVSLHETCPMRPESSSTGNAFEDEGWSRHSELRRGEIIHTQDAIDALHAGKIGGYGTDALDVEPPPPDHPMLNAPNTVITPHIGSRTFESVERQATMAARNLVLALRGETPLAQANDAPLTAHT